MKHHETERQSLKISVLMLTNCPWTLSLSLSLSLLSHLLSLPILSLQVQP